jgi:protocatechuate 3,4-dioxygenase, beta subunit
MGIPSDRSRRQFLSRLGAGAGAAAFLSSSLHFVRGALAEQLAITPRLTEGPFYPDAMPLDTDNDLLIVNDSITPAVGEITHLSGRILGSTGSPVRNAVVEIWQVDHSGIYLNSRDRNHENRDKNFQGYGRFLTDANGQYYFRTIKPVPYTGRCPHIHVAISQNGRRVYTTQLMIKGHPQNERDGVFRSAGSAAARNAIQVEFNSIADSKIGELSANFDVVMGLTPEDDHGAVNGGIGKSEGDRGGLGAPRGGPGFGRRGGPGDGFGPGPFNGPPPER